MKKIVLTLTAVMVLACQSSSFATSSVDALIQKLMDKGILTNQEAAQVKGEIASEEKSSQQLTFKTMLPDWINGIKITGDFRLRDQYQERKNVYVDSTTPPKNLADNRGRYRARLNFEDQINDKIKVIFGLATNGENSKGVGNPRSNNVTFGGNNSLVYTTTGSSTSYSSGEGSFNKPTVVINKAYAIYTPTAWLTLQGGKMDNPIWEPASLLWDPDLTPEGGNIQLQKKLNEHITAFANNSIFVLKDLAPSTGTAITSGYGSTTNGVKTDPYMFVTQEGIKGNLTDKVYYKAAGSYYNVSNPNHFPMDYRSSGNSTSKTANLTGTYSYNFNLVGGSVDLGINDPFGEMLPAPIYIPQAGVYGSYFRNVDPAHQNSAWLMGGYIGSSALNGFGTWKIQSYYKVLEADSWLDAFPDDDFYSGNTNAAGWRNQLDIGLAKNTWFTVSYFRTNVFKRPSDTAKSAPENLFQMDLNFKF